MFPVRVLIHPSEHKKSVLYLFPLKFEFYFGVHDGKLFVLSYIHVNGYWNERMRILNVKKTFLLVVEDDMTRFKVFLLYLPGMEFQSGFL